MRREIVIALMVAVLLSILSLSFYEKTHYRENISDKNVYYFNEDGEELGSTNDTIPRYYVIKTRKRKYEIYSPEEMKGDDDGVFPADVQCITVDTAQIVEGLIRDGRYNEDLVKRNIVEILSIEVIKKMYDNIKDNGNGGNVSRNNKEYGGVIMEDNAIDFVVEGISKGVCEKSNKFKAKIEFKGKAEFHSHPSGCRGPLPIYPCRSNYDARRTDTCWYQQGPSDVDQRQVGLMKNRIGYVFGMRARILYIYDKNGILATLPFEFFIPSSSGIPDHR